MGKLKTKNPLLKAIDVHLFRSMWSKVQEFRFTSAEGGERLSKILKGGHIAPETFCGSLFSQKSKIFLDFPQKYIPKSFSGMFVTQNYFFPGLCQKNPPLFLLVEARQRRRVGGGGGGARPIFKTVRGRRAPLSMHDTNGDPGRKAGNRQGRKDFQATQNHSAP